MDLVEVGVVSGPTYNNRGEDVYPFSFVRVLQFAELQCVESSFLDSKFGVRHPQGFSPEYCKSTEVRASERGTEVWVVLTGDPVSRYRKRRVLIVL